MAKIAIIFPGQGSQSVGMGIDLFNNFQIAKNVYNTAVKVLGKSISDICFNGPEDILKQTINTQPAILATSIAALEVLREQTNIDIAYTAGHSLGEYAAMYLAGVISLEDTIKIISKRAELMDKAANNTKGTMAAVLGLNAESVKKSVEQIDGIVSVANYNSPEQVVITGEIEAVNKAMNTLKEIGAKRVLPLAVSGAFHSALMKDTSIEFSNYINEITVNNASIPVITNTDAEITTNSDDFKTKMPRQIYSSVYWTQTIENMINNEVDIFIEVGPGKVLAGLNKKINPNVTTYNVYDVATLNSTIEALKVAQTI